MYILAYDLYNNCRYFSHQQHYTGVYTHILVSIFISHSFAMEQRTHLCILISHSIHCHLCVRMCLGSHKYICIWSIWLGIQFFFVFAGHNVLLMSTHNFVRLPWRDQPEIRAKWTKIKMTTICMLNRGQFDLYI